MPRRQRGLLNKYQKAGPDHSYTAHACDLIRKDHDHAPDSVPESNNRYGPKWHLILSYLL